MDKYSVKELSVLAGISIRTLRYYDQIGLLKPLIRTEAKYRFYGKEELLKLQQILFYRELGFPLKEICEIINDSKFDLIQALTNHRAALKAKRDRITVLINTIDNTIINHSKNDGVMLKPEDLYEGLSKETIKAYRTEAIKKYGEKAVKTSEKSLQKLTKEQLKNLRKEQQEISETLFSLMNEDYTNDKVQTAIARHYQITRRFWGTYGTSDPQKKQYAGLGELFTTDERFTMINGKPQPQFAKFMCKAIAYYVKYKLG